MEERLGRTETKIDKNTIMLEDLTKKVEIIAEIQTSHKEQNERESDKIIDTLFEKTNFSRFILCHQSKFKYLKEKN